MERSTPVRKPHTSTADLLTWSETPPPDSSAEGSAAGSAASRSAARSHQPSDGISKVVFGGQVTDEEVESLNKRKPCSGYKLKEITGSGIFVANGENDTEESGSANPTPNNKTGLRMYQQTIAGISHISFGEEESISTKKPTTVAEVAKLRELTGTLDSESEANMKKQLSDAKCKELSGHNIFAPPPEIKPRPPTARTLHLRGSIGIGEAAPLNDAGGNFVTSEEQVIKTAKKISNQKFSHLSGNDIFKGDVPPSSAEKPLSVAKLREISGSNIFADGKVESRDYLGGVRKPPGGDSSVALV
ncbi:Alpha-ketoglutarate-dependent dioxygenase alkB-like protein 2 [Quillaja saponaria]|uniref:Alpha-ketoglutarate-dependent dioxygenase alkB-like protein 2 n=1 Tax=Quillaja saponaria TaxID=32244 RepID=A0AAD7PKJ2_QUISA|nr:Alpha-ketoglutarate-dependent dioxygenase alkB-like protein 2 [Quillaja saponaria]